MPRPAILYDKLIHSQQSLKRLETILVGYYNREPYDIVGESDPASDGWLLSYTSDKPVPPSIALTIGDVLQNIRSELDYLVWELAKDKASRKTCFPICTTFQAFKEAKRTRLDGIDLDAIAVIDTLQPYHFGQGNEGSSPLFVLDELTNINKHRRLILTKLGFGSGDEISVFDGDGNLLGYDPLLATNTNAEFRIDPAQTEVNSKPVMFVAFDEGTAKGMEVTNCLVGLMQFVNDDLIPRFDKFFG